MPLWNIYHPDNIYTDQAEKDAFAAAITASYEVLPPFYVIVNFIPLPANNIYRSGKPISQLDKPFVRLVVRHLARHAADGPDLEEGYKRSRFVIDRAIKKHVVEKGYLWEYTVAEEDRNLWKIDGYMPPPFESEAMKLWKKEDKVSPY